MSKGVRLIEMQFLTYNAVTSAQPKAARGEAAKTIEFPGPDVRSGSLTTLGRIAAGRGRRQPSDHRQADCPLATCGKQLDIYVALPNGVYRYDAPAHRPNFSSHSLRK
jgi:hypothetical protein